ncbi:aminoglycoside phosphotransferase family protein [soil metagenome]
MHPNQLTITVGTVRRLIDGQFPAWRSLPITRIPSEGTVNAIFRLGARLAARFPLQNDDPEATRARLHAEAAAANELFGCTRFPTPEPVDIGEPGMDYPLPWSVQTWLPGTTATIEDASSSMLFAHDLAEFIAQTRAIDTNGRTFHGTSRGGDLLMRDEWMETCFQTSEHLIDVPRLRQWWREFRELPRTSADVMNHGDLTPGNVLVSAGRLAGVLDVGGLGPADPALDLVSAWHLLEGAPREALRDDLGSDDLEWERGRAWAFEQAMGAIWYYERSNPAMSQMGRRTLHRIAAATSPA